MDEKLNSENMQKSSFLCLCYILRAIRAGRCRERRYADQMFNSDSLQNAPYRSQIFKNFFASGGNGALTPLTKILRTFPARPHCAEFAVYASSRRHTTVGVAIVRIAWRLSVTAMTVGPLSLLMPANRRRDAGAQDCETFRTSSSLSKRTIRISDEDSIRYDTIRDAILTCARKPT